MTLNTGTNTLLITSKGGKVNLDEVEIIGGMAYRDEEAPKLIGTYPIENSGLLDEVSLYFSETITADAGSIIISDGENYTDTPNFDIEGSKITFNPDWSKLSMGKTYTVTVLKDKIKDISGNSIEDSHSFNISVPKENYTDNAFKYNDIWQDSKNGYISGTSGASVEFWYYGDKCVLRSFDANAKVKVWIDDYLVANEVVIDGDGNKDISFYNSGIQNNGIHNMRIEVVDGNFKFIGANVNCTLIDQPLNKDGWTAFGVREADTDPLSNAIDGDHSTRWTSLTPQNSTNRDWFAIDFGKEITLNTLLLVCRGADSNSEITDYGRTLEVYISDDGNNWKGPITTLDGSPMYTNIIFPTVTTRYVKIVQTGDSSSWWSINEVYGLKLSDEFVPEVVVPDAPEQLEAVSLNQQILLSWQASNNAVEYQIVRDGEVIDTTNVCSYVDRFNTNDKKMHTYVIYALDAYGNISEASKEIKVKTDSDATNIPRSGWKATASHSHSTVSPMMAIDDDIESRWTTGEVINNTMWYQVDMGSTFKFNSITMTTNLTDFPTEYEITVSEDGNNWSEIIASDTGAPNTTEINLKEVQNARYINIRQTSDTPRSDWWSIYDFKVEMKNTEEVDKTALKIALDKANEITDEDLENVVPVVVEEFKAALQEANDVYADASATQEQVNNAFDRLASAMQKLEFFKGDKDSLEAFVNKVSSLEKDKYTEATWDAFETALENANKVLADENALEKEVNEAYDVLVRAFLDLRLIPNKELLNDLINKAESLEATNYTADSFKAMQEALASAKVVADNENATQAEVDNAKDVLAKAIANLQANTPADNTANTPTTDTKVTTSVNSGDTRSVKTGDNSLFEVFGSIALLSAAGISLLRKKED